MLRSGGTGCGREGPGSVWGFSRVVRLLCHTVPPPSEETPGAIPGTRWHQPAWGSTGDSWGGWREAAGGRVVHPHPATGTAPHEDAHGVQGPPCSLAAGCQRRVSRRAVGALWGGWGVHGACGHSGAEAGCHRSCGWLCGVGQLGCHCWGLGTSRAAWGAARKQDRALAASSEPPSPAQPWGAPRRDWLTQCCPAQGSGCPTSP